MKNDIYKKIRKFDIIVAARVLLFLDLFERIELRIYLGSHSGTQRHPSTSAFQVLELKVCAATPSHFAFV